MLKKEGKINDAIIENMLSWYHSSFNVYLGDRIEPDDNLLCSEFYFVACLPRLIPADPAPFFK